MQNAISYLLSANLLLCVVVIYYRVLLARQTRFQLNRAFLLGGTVLSFALPLLRIVSSSGDPIAFGWAGVGVVRSLPEVIIGTGSQAVSEGESAVGWMEWISGAYLLVACLLGAMLLYRLVSLALRIVLAHRERQNGYTLVHGVSTNGPASFFGFLLWDNSLEAESEGAAVILAHERCHIRQWHSLDLIFTEILSVICWFNPAVYLFRRDLRQCHEFLADEAAAKVGGKEALFREVLKRQFGTPDFTLANHFQSQIKARITMLNLKSRHKALVRYLMILPLAGMMFACTSIENEDVPENGPDAVNASNMSSIPPPPPIKNDYRDATGDGEVEDFAEESPRLLDTNALPPVLGTDPGPNDFVQLDKEPKPLNMTEVAKAIGYPDEAKEAEITGKVIMRVKVDKKGSVTEHVVIKESHMVLREAVEEKLYDLKFEPGVKDGKKVNTWVTIPFRFEL
jgi:TonB family protein